MTAPQPNQPRDRDLIASGTLVSALYVAAVIVLGVKRVLDGAQVMALLSPLGTYAAYVSGRVSGAKGERP